MHDLIIKDGRVIDQSQGLDDVLDVAINGDKIAAIRQGIPTEEGKRVIDASGKIVVPGLIDLHTHCAGGLLAAAVDPDIAGVLQGVTTVVDAGTTGASSFVGFPRYVVPASRTRVFCFLHISSAGLCIMPELRDRGEISPEACAATIERHKGLIKGLKIRLLGNVTAQEGAKIVETAKGVARRFQMPLMVHLGDPEGIVAPSLTREALRLLDKGDIVSHIYTPLFGGALDPSGAVLPELFQARDRGVVLDVAMGNANISFEVARKVMAQGVLPTTLSTDLLARTSRQRVFGMTVAMSKFLAMGLDLKQVVRMSTTNPAMALSEGTRIGGLRPGMEADVSVLELRSGNWRTDDSQGNVLDLDRLIVPCFAVRAGQVISANPAGQLQPLPA